MLPGVSLLFQTIKYFSPSPSAPKPLSYPSLTCVLKYLEANQRIQLSSRCPAIRSTERNIPLRIYRLTIEESTLVINKTVYTIEVQSSFGTSGTTDLNHFGATDLDQVVEQGPDEILLDTRSNDLEELRIDSESKNIVNECKRIAEIPNEEAKAKAEITFRRRAVMHQVNAIRWIARKVNAPPGVTMMQIPVAFTIRLAIKDHREVVTRENMIYSKKLHETMKYLLLKMLGGRKIIKVYCFSIVCRGGILRLPADLNIQFLNLGVYSAGTTDAILWKIRHFLAKSKVPMKSMEIQGANNFDSPIIQLASKLVLHYGFELGKLLDKATGFRSVYLQRADSFLIREAFHIMHKWLTVGREVGSCWGFSLESEAQAKVVMEKIRRDRFALMLGESEAILFMNHTAHIYIFHEKDTMEGSEWVMNFTVRKNLFVV